MKRNITLLYDKHSFENTTVEREEENDFRKKMAFGSNWSVNWFGGNRMRKRGVGHTASGDCGTHSDGGAHT